MSHASKTIAAGEFKSKCLKIMDEVQTKHISYTLTKRGVPVARLVPVSKEPTAPFFGCMRGMVKIHGDILAPMQEDWEAER